MFLRARLGAALLSLVLAVLVLAVGPRPALAWVDVNVEADDVRVAVDENGDARVEHKITLKVAGGPLRSFDIRGVDADAVPDAEGYVVPQREAAKSSLASAQAVVAERMPPSVKPLPDGSPAPPVLRIRFDPDRGLMRGVHVLFVRYTTHHGARIKTDGALTRIAWRGPIWDDGLDSARVTFELPAAPTEPRADDPEPAAAGGVRPPLVLSTLRRGVAKDQLELLRPYAPKGEAITWSIRADSRAFQRAVASPSRPERVRAVIQGAVGEPAQRALLGLGALSLFLLYASLVALKSGEVARHARAAGVTPRPLVPLPTTARAILAGAALVAGLFVELLLMRATLGASLVLAAVLFASHRTPRWPRPSLRSPGRWLPLSEAVAFRAPPRPRGAYLDVSTRAGKIALLVVLAAVLACVARLYQSSPFRAQLIAFDAVALLAIFCTGRLAELPPNPGLAPARLLRDVARSLRKTWPDKVRIVGRIRVPDGSAVADELRLVALPKGAPAGFVALEVGVVHLPGAGGPLASPEVLLRVTAGSVCEQMVARLVRHGHGSRGRKQGERAILFTPHLPTAKMTAGLVTSLLRPLITSATSQRQEQRGHRSVAVAAGQRERATQSPAMGLG